MKKTLSLVLSTILCVSALSACGSSQEIPNTTATTSTTTPIIDVNIGKNSLIIYEDDSYIVTLPVSGREIKVGKKYEEYLPYVTDELIRSAEEKIAETVDIRSSNVGFYITSSKGRLYISGEAIEKIDPPESAIVDGEVVAGGCNIDHKHVFFSEPISNAK